MSDFIECVECGFVLLADDAPDPRPKRVDSCPDCDSTEFSGASTSDLPDHDG